LSFASWIAVNVRAKSMMLVGLSGNNSGLSYASAGAATIHMVQTKITATKPLNNR
jgi:hypothetical protein